jgi:hypothetical protein
MTTPATTPDLSVAVTHLMKGVIYRDTHELVTSPSGQPAST